MLPLIYTAHEVTTRLGLAWTCRNVSKGLEVANGDVLISSPIFGTHTRTSVLDDDHDSVK